MKRSVADPCKQFVQESAMSARVGFIHRKRIQNVGFGHLGSGLNRYIEHDISLEKVFGAKALDGMQRYSVHRSKHVRDQQDALFAD